MNLTHYLGLLHRAQTNLADAYRDVGGAHRAEPDVQHECIRFARQCDHHAELLAPIVDRYGEDADDEPDRLHSEMFKGTRTGGLGLLRDLHDLYLMATECDISWIVVGQAAKGARDGELEDVVGRCESETTTQLKWLRTRMKSAAPQALVVT
jgi:hypothetical protein